MGADKTYIFDGATSGGGLDIAALVSSMMGNKGMDPNLIAALMNGNNNRGSWGGDGCWWIWIILLFFCWGGNGFGFGNNGVGGGLPAQLNGDAGRELLMNAIQGNGTAINQLASSIGCSTQQLQSTLCNIQSQLGLTGQQTINAIQSMGCQIGNQIAQCCCDMRTAIERQGADIRLQNCQNMNMLTNTMNGNTLQLRDANLANTQAILAKVDAFESRYQQDKLNNLLAENNALKGQLSQEHQNAYFNATINAATAPIVSRLNSLQGDVDGIKCKLPNTVSVPYPQLSVFNPECYRAAAFGAAAGTYAAEGGPYANCGC
jgi:hypothetical protein